jgi:hypothetical protein
LILGLAFSKALIRTVRVSGPLVVMGLAHQLMVPAATPVGAAALLAVVVGDDEDDLVPLEPQPVMATAAIAAVATAPVLTPQWERRVTPPRLAADARCVADDMVCFWLSIDQAG